MRKKLLFVLLTMFCGCFLVPPSAAAFTWDIIPYDVSDSDHGISHGTKIKDGIVFNQASGYNEHVFKFARDGQSEMWFLVYRGGDNNQIVAPSKFNLNVWQPASTKGGGTWGVRGLTPNHTYAWQINDAKSQLRVVEAVNLYVQGNDNKWYCKATLTPNTEGKYVMTDYVEIPSGSYFVFGKVYNNPSTGCKWDDIATTYYPNQGSDKEVGSGLTEFGISTSTTKAWLATEDLKVKITLDTANNKALFDHNTMSRCADPTFSPDGGTFDSKQKVTINCANTEATIYYTTDGSIPTKDSDNISPGEKVTIESSCTLKAIAMCDGYSNSGVKEADFKIVRNASYTIFVKDEIGWPAVQAWIHGNGESGTHVDGVCVDKTNKIYMIKFSTVANQVMFRCDGDWNNQTAGSADLVNRALYTISGSSGKNATVTKTQDNYSLKCANPVFSPANGFKFVGTTNVTLTCATEGATIMYATDPDDLPDAGEVYSAPFTTSNSGTSKKYYAVAIYDGLTNSDIVAVTYTRQTKETEYTIYVKIPSAWNNRVTLQHFQQYPEGTQITGNTNVNAVLVDAGQSIYEVTFKGVSDLYGRFVSNVSTGTPKTSDFKITNGALYTISGMTGNVYVPEVSPNYNFKHTCQNPVFIVNGVQGTSFNISDVTKVTIRTSTPNASIYYEYMDGDTEVANEVVGTTDENGSYIELNIPITVTSLSASALRTGYNSSTTVKAKFTYINPADKQYYLVFFNASAPIDLGTQTFTETKRYRIPWSVNDQRYVVDLKNVAAGHCAIVMELGSEKTLYGHAKDGNNSYNIEPGHHTDLLKNSYSLYYYPNGKNVQIQLLDNGDDSNVHMNVIQLPDPILANLPLAPRDFVKGPKYFLVGTRQGAFQLQPEWMFEEDEAGNLVLDGRFMYPGKFAVARVDSYNNYAQHIYDVFYSDNSNIEGTSDEFGHATANIEYNKYAHLYNAHEGRNKEGNPKIFQLDGFNNGNWFSFDNDPAKSDAIGTWCESIKLTLGEPDNKALPIVKSVSFDIQNDINTRAQHRVFQLVGDKVYNATYHNGDGQHNTMLAPSNMPGWQEGYIQYDGYNKPYFDAYGDYIYFTGYSDRVFNNVRKSIFRMDLGGGEFSDFDSETVTFVDASTFTEDELNEDPYREYYKHFTGGKKTIQNGLVEAPEGLRGKPTSYKFRISGLNAAHTSDDWHCYVVKDAWMAGEFKIWTGWGGCTTGEDGDGGTSARWNHLNAGSATAGGLSIPSTGSDIFASLDTDDENVAALASYRLYGDRQAGSNLAFPENDLVYYNRVILWYSPKLGTNECVIQFIQETASPTIEASLQSGVEKKNKAQFKWNLNNAAATDDTPLKSYTIERWRMEEGGREYNDFVTSGTFTDADNTVAKFAAAHPNGMPTYKDDEELAAGQYYYKIILTFGDDSKKENFSNPVYVYDDAEVASPMCSITQLIRLEKDGFDYIKANTSAFQDAQFDSDYGTVFCLTYRPASAGADAQYYALRYKEGSNEMSPEFASVKREQYRAIINDPSKFTWTAYFLVRALDLDFWNDNVEEGQFGNKFHDANITSLVVTDVQDSNKPYTTVPVIVGNKEYMAAFVNRRGLLRPGDIDVVLKYDVQYDEQGSDIRHNTATINSRVMPEVPKPFYQGYAYSYRIDPGNPITTYINSREPGHPFYTEEEVDASQVIVTMNTRDSQGTTHEVQVAESDMQGARHLDVVFSIDRPNVSQAIFEKYNIFYDVEFSTEVVTTGTGLADAPADLELTDFSKSNGWYYDASEADTEYGESLYHLTVTDVHPYAYAVPRLQIKNVEYRNVDGNAEHVLAANYGYDIDDIAYQSPQKSFQIGRVGLGVNHGKSALITNEYGQKEYKEYGPWTWYLVSHTDFEVNPDVDFDNTNESDAHVATAPSLFQVEMTADYATNNRSVNIIVHDPTHVDCDSVMRDGLKWFDYALPGKKLGTLGSEESDYKKPSSIIFTPVYTFVRNASADGSYGSTTASITELVYAGSNTPTPAQIRRRAAGDEDAAPEEPNTKFVPNDEYLTRNDDGTYTYNGTNGDVVLYRGASSTSSGANNTVMTGIEDVIADGESYDGPAQYYNLQGIQVANPEPGQFYIKKVGKTATKIRF